MTYFYYDGEDECSKMKSGIVGADHINPASDYCIEVEPTFPSEWKHQLIEKEHLVPLKFRTGDILYSKNTNEVSGEVMGYWNHGYQMRWVWCSGSVLNNSVLYVEEDYYKKEESMKSFKIGDKVKYVGVQGQNGILFKSQDDQLMVIDVSGERFLVKGKTSCGYQGQYWISSNLLECVKPIEGKFKVGDKVKFIGSQGVIKLEYNTPHRIVDVLKNGIYVVCGMTYCGYEDQFEVGEAALVSVDVKPSVLSKFKIGDRVISKHNGNKFNVTKIDDNGIELDNIDGTDKRYYTIAQINDICELTVKVKFNIKRLYLFNALGFSSNDKSLVEAYDATEAAKEFNRLNPIRNTASIIGVENTADKSLELFGISKDGNITKA